MNLTFQIEEQKRKSHLIGDFVIEAAHIETLASHVLKADEKTQQTPAFQEACETLRQLCDNVRFSVRDLQEMIPMPVIMPVVEPEIIPPTD